MIIKLSPVFYAPELTVIKSGDCLTINGIDYDFTPLPEGATLPASAIYCPHITGDVERIGGEIVLTLILPCNPASSESARFPEPLHITYNGPVELPV